MRPHQDAINKKRNKSKLPYAFTEQGVAMLSAVLHSDKAIEVSIKIINAFIEMRKFIINNQMLFEKISKTHKALARIKKRVQRKP